MTTVFTQDRTNILKLVAGMFNAAPGAAYLNEFTDAYVAMNKDLGALAAGLGRRPGSRLAYQPPAAPPPAGADRAAAPPAAHPGAPHLALL